MIRRSLGDIIWESTIIVNNNSQVFLILRRSRIDRKQDLKTEEIWSDIESTKNNAKIACRVSWFNDIRWHKQRGTWDLASWAGRPMWRNSVLDWLYERRSSYPLEDKINCDLQVYNVGEEFRDDKRDDTLSFISYKDDDRHRPISDKRTESGRVENE